MAAAKAILHTCICLAQAGVFVNSQYSGIGSCEAIVSFLANEVAGEEAQKVTCFAACDKDPVCLQVLASHTGPSAARHLFQNIEHRFDAELANNLCQKGQAASAQAKAIILAEGKPGQ